MNSPVSSFPLKFATALLAFQLSASAADVTFYAYSDCHYGAGKPPAVTRPQVDWINGLPGTDYPKEIGGVVDKPRAVIMAGDLIDQGWNADRYQIDWKNYNAEFGVNGEGRCKFPVFEGHGNHDWNPNLFVYNKIKERNLERKKLGYIGNISKNGYHYSWDWDGIHFVNLNIFPGNEWHGEADTYGQGSHDPMFSRDFLEKDLKENVGDSGRPVILVHHFRPVDENWWTYSAADKYQRILQNYNVIMIMVGHQGGGVDNHWRGIRWASSNGELEVFHITPDNVITAIPRKASQWDRPMQQKFFMSYATSGLPAVVNNGSWASDVTTDSATLAGKILYLATPDADAVIYWGTQDGGGDAGRWEHSAKVGSQKTGLDFETKVTGLKPWTQYFYRCEVTNKQGTAWAAASIPFFTRGVLPTGWETTFVGYVQRPGNGANRADDGAITVRGSGRDIGEPGETIDNFQYAYGKTGAGAQIQARLKGMEGNTRVPMAGVMLRESTADDAKSVALLYNKQGVRLFSRSETAGKTTIGKPSAITAPAYLKLKRTGDTFTGFASADGSEWSQIGNPVTVKMDAGITGGLAVTAGNRDGSRNQDAVFDNIELK